MALITGCSIKWEFCLGLLSSGLDRAGKDSPSTVGSVGPLQSLFPRWMWGWGVRGPLKSKTTAWVHVYRTGSWKVYQFECKLQVIFLKLYETEILESIYLKRLDFLRFLIMGIKTASLAECCIGIGQITTYFYFAKLVIHRKLCLSHAINNIHVFSLREETVMTFWRKSTAPFLTQATWKAFLPTHSKFHHQSILCFTIKLQANLLKDLK